MAPVRVSLRAGDTGCSPAMRGQIPSSEHLFSPAKMERIRDSRALQLMEAEFLSGMVVSSPTPTDYTDLDLGFIDQIERA